MSQLGANTPISGIAGFHGSGDETLLQALAATLAHRGAKESFGTEGSVGLAIRSADASIASDPNGAVAVVDGPSSIGEQAVHLYAQGGVAGLASLPGRYALALYDPHGDVLVLARDASGAAPLYYAQREGGVVFASEPVTLLAVGAVEAAPDEQTVRRFVLTGRSDDTEATFFAGIRQVLPGHVVTVAATGISSEPLPVAAPAPLTVDAAVRAAAEATEQTAVRFGHGLPGAVLTAAAALPVFSASFKPMDPSEDSYVDAVVATLGATARHQRVEVNSDTLVADLSDFISEQGEPVAELEAYVQYALARAAGEAGADVLVDPAGASSAFSLPVYESGKKARKRVDPTTLVRIPAPAPVEPGVGGIAFTEGAGPATVAAVRRAADRTSARSGVRVALPYVEVGPGHSADELRGLLPAPLLSAADAARPAAPARDWLLRLKNRIYGVFMEEAFVNRNWFDQQAVMVAFEDFIKNRNADADLFWRIWSVEMWAREFFDPKPAEDDEPVRIKGPLEPNQNKQLEITVDGERWIRFPIRTDLFTKGDPYQERITAYVRDLVREARADERYAASFGKAWYLLVSEKIVAISQGRSYFIWDIEPSWWARTLSKFVVRTPYGIGLGSPWTMELAIKEAGLSRILLASGVSAAGKAVGKRGLFYQVAGHSVRAIDGPTEYSVFPANVSAKLAPAEPDKVAAELTTAVRAALSADGLGDVATSLAGVVVIDANDIGRNVLGRNADRPEVFFEELFRDNPLGQGSEQTPLAVAVQAP
jgi:asparagine synthase (glutamine-hydrolysing)